MRRGGGELTVATSCGEALVLLDEAPEPAFLVALTHGAAGGVAAPDLLATRDAALELGGAVARIVQPYRVRGGRAPGSAARQDAAWIEVVGVLREMARGQREGVSADAPPGASRAASGPPARAGPAAGAGAVPGGPGGRGWRGSGISLIQGGRSNGARLACRTAPAVRADGVIALAFPVHPPGHPERSRRSELLAAGVDVLAVSGSKDPFGVPDPADTGRLVVLEGEGHALSKNPAAVGAAVSAWLRQRL